MFTLGKIYGNGCILYFETQFGRIVNDPDLDLGSHEVTSPLPDGLCLALQDVSRQVPLFDQLRDSSSVEKIDISNRDGVFRLLKNVDLAADSRFQQLKNLARFTAVS